MPTAEATGLIVPIGRWVLEEACTQAQRWQLDTLTEPKLSMSANLSPRELREPGLVENVAAILRRTGVDPSTIVLEITETSMVEDADGAIATLQALKALGVRLAIDDFGTGYSSLSYLRRLPVDVLKLDRSFVVPAGRGDRESALVDAVFRLGRSLGLVTIAEGIEDAEQRDRLVSLGCRVGPGLPVRATDGRARGVRVPGRQPGSERRCRGRRRPGSRRGRLSAGRAEDPDRGQKKNPGVVGSRGSGGCEVGCGEGIRTPDLRVMSPTSCRCSTPRRL